MAQDVAAVVGGGSVAARLSALASELASRARLAALLAAAAAAGFAVGALVTYVQGLREAAAASSSSSSSSSAAAAPVAASALPWAGRSVLVTGASSGIGRAIAIRLAARGARVAVHYSGARGRGGADETLALIRAAAPPGGAPAAAAFAADLGGGVDVGAAARGLVLDVLRAFGGQLDVLVNCAGVYDELALGAAPDARTSLADELDGRGDRGAGAAPSLAAFLRNWRAAFSLNVEAAAALTFVASRHMVRAAAAKRAAIGVGAGGAATAAIVNVGSRGAFRGEPAAWAYGASKAALHALAQSAAVALAPFGVVCANVAPGFVETPMAAAALAGERGAAIRAQSAWGRIASPEEVAAAVDFAARYWESAFHSGGTIDVNGASYLRT